MFPLAGEWQVPESSIKLSGVEFSELAPEAEWVIRKNDFLSGKINHLKAGQLNGQFVPLVD